jgi:hypothetical protein
MSEVLGAIGALERDRTVKVQTAGGGSYTYDYVSESSLMTTVRDELSKRGVAVYVSVLEQEVRPTGAKAGPVTHVKMSITFADGPTGETFTIYGQGQGQDASDKGVYKAITSCTRYMLWKQFLIPTEADDVNNAMGEGEYDQHTGDAPVSIVDAKARLAHFIGDDGLWIKEAMEKLHPGLTLTNWKDLDEQVKLDGVRRLMSVVVELEKVADEGEIKFTADDLAPAQATVQAAFAGAFEGLRLRP